MFFYGYKIENVKEHVEVYKDDEFQFTADDVSEAKQDILEILG